jgi:hypothetical protein
MSGTTDSFAAAARRTGGNLPNLLVIGGMKCGTSSLHYYLSLHPEIFMSEEKELCFFAERWDRGLDWYARQFPSAAPVRGESSPNYTKYPKLGGVPARIHSVVPDARLVYLVRDPVERIVSHYVDACSWGRERRTLDDAVREPEDNHYVNCSRYAMQLEQYLPYFPQSSILVVTSDDLREHRRETLGRIFGFLDVDARWWDAACELVLNTTPERRRKNLLGRAAARAAGRLDATALAVTGYRHRAKPLVRAFVGATSSRLEPPRLSAARERELRSILGEDVARLRELTGLALDSWDA